MKKGQAAMEFLMTYGWAILIVLVAIGSIAYFGVNKLYPIPQTRYCTQYFERFGNNVSKPHQAKLEKSSKFEKKRKGGKK